MTGSMGTLPRNWEQAFGYDGEARYVAFYWTPIGDEARYDDGHASGDGNWQMFLLVRHEHPELDRRYNLGYSETEADDWLLFDRETRELVVLPKAEAQTRLRQQYPSTPRAWPPLDLDAELTPLDWEIIQEAVQQALDNAEAAMQHIRPCDTCFLSIAPGWLRTEDGGFDRCPACDGWGFLPVPETATDAEAQPARTLFYRRES
ncbi:MAG: hypothetical protein JXM73_06790 [Anaerolineae bacterium]|nr:hypothetical protein [Anaerolineae bacterium]